MNPATDTLDDGGPEDRALTKKELVAAMLRANTLLTTEWGYNELEEANALAAQHYRFMRDIETVEEWQNLVSQLELETSV